MLLHGTVCPKPDSHGGEGVRAALKDSSLALAWTVQAQEEIAAHSTPASGARADRRGNRQLHISHGGLARTGPGLLNRLAHEPSDCCSLDPGGNALIPAFSSHQVCVALKRHRLMTSLNSPLPRKKHPCFESCPVSPKKTYICLAYCTSIRQTCVCVIYIIKYATHKNMTMAHYRIHV